MERLFRRAGLRPAMSQGFHPKPRMSFPSALALGIEGLDEVMELELAAPAAADDLLARLRQHALPGLDFPSAELLPPGAGKGRLRSATYEVRIPASRRADLADRIARLLAGSSCPIARTPKQTPLDLRPLVEDLSLRDGVLRMRLGAGPQGCAGPRHVLAVLGLADLEPGDARPTRTRVELQP